MTRKHKGVQLIGVANKNSFFLLSRALLNDLKHNKVSFSTDVLCLRVALMHRSRDLTIFMQTNRQTDGRN